MARAVAGALAGVVREKGTAELQAIGAAAINQAVKAIAIAQPSRNELLPDTPTFEEAGLKGINASTWWGIVAPAGTPAPIVEKLYKALTEAQDNPDVKKYFDNEGATIAKMSSTEFGQFMVSEMNKWERVVKAAHIKAE